MEYIRPQNIKDALHVMKRSKGAAKLIAGGTNIIPDMRANVINPKVLVDISHLKNLTYIKEEKKMIKIGSLTIIAELASSKIIQRYVPILSEAANQFGNPLVRNRATIGGNLANASPAADTAVPLLILEAMLVIESDGGSRREIPIDQFFLGPSQTVLKPGEIIREVLFPKPDPNSRMVYTKLGLRNAMAISVVSVAFLMEGGNNECNKARIGIGAVAPKPIRAYEIEQMLKGKKIMNELIDACSVKVQEEINPITDIRASAEYRRYMASVLVKRVIRQVTLDKIE